MSYLFGTIHIFAERDFQPVTNVPYCSTCVLWYWSWRYT